MGADFKSSRGGVYLPQNGSFAEKKWFFGIYDDVIEIAHPSTTGFIFFQLRTILDDQEKIDLSITNKQNQK